MSTNMGLSFGRTPNHTNAAIDGSYCVFFEQTVSGV
jgi:hypothetical protein